MEEIERLEALKNAEDGAKEAMDGAAEREKQLDNVEKLEGYIDGEINDLFDANHMQGQGMQGYGQGNKWFTILLIWYSNDKIKKKILSW